MARCSHAFCFAAIRRVRSCPAPAAPSPCRRCPDKTRWRTRNTSPTARVFGRFTDQSPLRRTSLVSSQSAARRSAGSGAPPPHASANAAIAVSHTTEKQGWKKNRSLIVHHQQIELPLRFHAVRMIRRIAQQIERHDRRTSSADKSPPARRSTASAPASIVPPGAAPSGGWRASRIALPPFQQPVQRRKTGCASDSRPRS